MKRKILLINPAFKISQTAYKVLRHPVPLGLLNLASFISKKDYECDIVNTAFEEMPWDNIKKNEYLLAGFTIFVGEFLKNAKELKCKVYYASRTFT